MSLQRVLKSEIMDPIGGNLHWNQLNYSDRINFNFFFYFLNAESTKFFEVNGFVYKKVNGNDKTVYLDCLNKPHCSAVARFYKKSKSIRLLGDHAIDICPPDDKIKRMIHFEEFLKKYVLEKVNATHSILNLYKRVARVRYEGLWLPEDHRQKFLPILRRLRNSKKSIANKPKQPKNGTKNKCEAATSPIVDLLSRQVDNFCRSVLVPPQPLPSTQCDWKVAAESNDHDEMVRRMQFVFLKRANITVRLNFI